MTAAQYSRGQVVLADFPFTERPHERGPRQHFCLVIDTVESQEERLIAICYGTSRLDDDLLAAHGGGVLSIPRAFMKIRSGFMDEVVGHFVLDHVALVPESWLDPGSALDSTSCARKPAKTTRSANASSRLLSLVSPSCKWQPYKQPCTRRKPVASACPQARRFVPRQRVDVLRLPNL